MELYIVNSLILRFIQAATRKSIGMDKKIIVIGVGAAGAAAATKLVSNGFTNVTILEAENRIGGRINIIPFGGNVVDMRAQWFVVIILNSFDFYSSFDLFIVLCVLTGVWVRKKMLSMN